MGPTSVARKVRVGGRAALRAWLLALAALLVLGPAIASAADPEPAPTPIATDAPTDTPSPSPTPSPTSSPTPTPDPTSTPTPGPTAEPTPSPTAEPTPSPTATPGPTPRIDKFLIYRRSAIVRQYTSYWCVPAAAQTMWNLISGGSNTTYARQRIMYWHIRWHNRYKYSTPGNDVQGWAWGLRHWTDQPYYAHAYVSKTVAMESIVAAIDRTHHPVGIVVRAGTHAWVVLGYRVSVDPADPTRRTLLGFYVSGPLGSPKDPYPYKYLTLDAFRKEFTRYHEWQHKVIWEGLYVMVND